MTQSMKDLYPDEWNWAFAGPDPAYTRLGPTELRCSLHDRTGRVWSASYIREMATAMGLRVDPKVAALDRDALLDDAARDADRPGVIFEGENKATLVSEVAATKVTPDELLQERGLDPDDWVIARMTVNRWESVALIDGEPRITELSQLKVHVERRRPFLLVLPPPEPRPFHAPDPRPETDRPRLILVTTDMQIPFHDPALHDLSLEFAHAMAVDDWTDLGDYLDLPSLSRWRKKPKFSATLQESIDAGGRILAERAQAAPRWCKKLLLHGNHDVRMDTWLLDHAPDFFGIRRAQIGPDENTSVLDLGYLMHADTSGWEVKGEYPYNEVEVAPGLVAMHGDTVRKGAGNTVREELLRRNHSVLHGHVNNLSLVSLTRNHPGGEKFTTYGVECGLMCTREGSLGFGSPSADWNAGFITVTVWPDGRWHIDLVPYEDRTITWRDRRWSIPVPH